MLGKSAWVSFIYLFALLLIVSCVILGAMMVNKATRPYYAMLDTPQKIRDGKLDHYLTGENHSKIYDLINMAVAEISREEYQAATEHINQASSMDPGNSLFSYLMAGLCFKHDDYTHMWRYIKTGNDLGKVRLYSTQYIPPESWTHPEIPVLRHMATTMSRSIAPEQELWELVRMGDALARCEPADVDTFAAGLSIRDSASHKIKELASLDGNTRVIKLCNKLAAEKFEAYKNYEEVMASVSLRKVSVPTLLMAMASYRRNPHVREALLVNALERQSEAVVALRARILVTPVGSKL